MATPTSVKVYTKGNFFFVVNSDKVISHDNKENTVVTKYKSDSTAYTFSFRANKNIVSNVEFSDIVDENENPYVSISAFETWVYQNTGVQPVTVSGGSSVVNLGYTASPTNGIVTNDSGDDATIPLATGTNAGLLSPTDFTTLTTDTMKVSVYDTDLDGIVDSSEKEVLQVRNATGSTILKGSVVYINGAIGQLPTITLADADTELTSSKTIGLALTDIANNTNGSIITSGVFHNLDTSLFADGNSLWLSSTAGQMVANTPPDEPAHAVFIGYVAYAHNTNGKIVVAIQNGYELNELHGVKIVSETDNDTLLYELSTGLWKNKPLTKNLVGLGNVVNLDTSNPVNITQSSSYRFVTDTEKTTWNNKQDALGFTPENIANKQTDLTASATKYPTVNAVNTGLGLKENSITAGTTSQYWRGDKSWQILDKTAVGLSNVVNLDTSNPANIVQTSSYRFVTDAEKATWNSITPPFIPAVSSHEVFRGVNYSNNSTTEVTSGGVTMATTASTIARSVSSTNFASKQIRKGFYASVVSTGRYTGTRGSNLLWYIGGGFRYVCEFYVSDTAYGSGCRQFYGMYGATTDLTYTDTIFVDTMINVIGIGSDALDTNLQVFHNDGSGTCTKIDLGANFPANRTAGSAMSTTYSIEIYNVNNAGNVLYKVTNNETGYTSEGNLSTNLPLSTQGLNFIASRCMGTAITNTGQFDLSLLGVYSL